MHGCGSQSGWPPFVFFRCHPPWHILRQVLSLAWDSLFQLGGLAIKPCLPSSEMTSLTIMCRFMWGLGLYSDPHVGYQATYLSSSSFFKAVLMPSPIIIHYICTKVPLYPMNRGKHYVSMKGFFKLKIWLLPDNFNRKKAFKSHQLNILKLRIKT